MRTRCTAFEMVFPSKWIFIQSHLGVCVVWCCFWCDFKIIYDYFFMLNYADDVIHLLIRWMKVFFSPSLFSCSHSFRTLSSPETIAAAIVVGFASMCARTYMCWYKAFFSDVVAFVHTLPLAYQYHYVVYSHRLGVLMTRSIDRSFDW